MRLLKLSVILLSLSSCGSGPKIKVCLSSPEDNTFVCYDAQTEQHTVINFADTENFICISPEDEKTLLNYCKLK